MKIAILGAGNSGLGMAAHLSYFGHNINLWNRSETRLKSLSDGNELICSGVISKKLKLGLVTTDLAVAISKVNLIIVTTPATAHADIAEMLSKLDMVIAPILLSPGRTLGAYCFTNVLKKSGVHFYVAEAQTVIHACRDLGEGRVHIFSIKPCVEIAAMTDEDTDLVISAMPFELKRHFIKAESWIHTSLGNIGYILHCAPMILNTGWIENKHQRFNFYRDGISPKVARFIEQLDTERLLIGKAYGADLDSIHQWLNKMYGTPIDTLYTMLQHTGAYQFIEAPRDMYHRYIQEDVPCGLVPIESIALQYKILTPATSTMIDLASLVFEHDYRNSGRVMPKDLVSL